MHPEWRTLSDGLNACFRTEDFADGARLVEAIAGLDADADVDVRHDSVTVRIPADSAELADQISAAARGRAADPSTLQAIGLVIEASAIDEVMPFWSAVLGYRRDGQRLVDPRARGWSLAFEQLTEPRPLRNRFHFDLSTAFDVADERRAAALANGGHVVNEERPWVIADAEGNEICAGGADPGLVPREPAEREPWHASMADGATGLVEVDWRQLHETPGLEDWRMLNMGVATHFRTGSFARGAQLVSAICSLEGLGKRRPNLDQRPDGLTVRIITLTETFGGPASQYDVELALRISAIARGLGIPSDPTMAQTVSVSIDALHIPDVMPFWCAVLGYEKRLDVDEDILDPQGRWGLFWFQQMDEPRPQRNRIHVELSLPRDQVDRRIAAALAAGGSRLSDDLLADSEGNEVRVR
jgi:4a-hydroxytetrahydrobiopterin dehydratase